MLVSGYTVSVWTDWERVPDEIFKAFSEPSLGFKTPTDIIVFVPTIVEKGAPIPGFLKALNVGEGVQFSKGKAYVAKGEVESEEVKGP